MRFSRHGTIAEYEPTEQDALWLARAVEREGPPHKGVAWTLVQRFAWLHPTGTYPTVASLVQAYAQPVNPRWFPDGDKHQQYLTTLSSQAQVAEANLRAERRREYASTPWEHLSPEAKAAANEALQVLQESPVPGAVHFRAAVVPRNATKQQAYQLAQRYADGRDDLDEVVRPIAEGYGEAGPVNWLFTAPGSKSLRLIPDGDELLAQPTPPVVLPDPPTMPPPGAAAGAGEWVLLWCWVPSHLQPPASTAPDPPADKKDEGAPAPLPPAAAPLVPQATDAAKDRAQSGHGRARSSRQPSKKNGKPPAEVDAS